MLLAVCIPQDTNKLLIQTRKALRLNFTSSQLHNLVKLTDSCPQASYVTFTDECHRLSFALVLQHSENFTSLEFTVIQPTGVSSVYARDVTDTV